MGSRRSLFFLFLLTLDFLGTAHSAEMFCVEGAVQRARFRVLQSGSSVEVRWTPDTEAEAARILTEAQARLLRFQQLKLEIDTDVALADVKLKEYEEELERLLIRGRLGRSEMSRQLWERRRESGMSELLDRQYSIHRRYNAVQVTVDYFTRELERAQGSDAPARVELLARSRLSSNSGVQTSRAMVLRHFSTYAGQYRAAIANGYLALRDQQLYREFSYNHPPALGTPLEAGYSAPTAQVFSAAYDRAVSGRGIPPAAQIRPVEFVVLPGPTLEILPLGASLPEGAEIMRPGLNWPNEVANGALGEIRIVRALARNAYPLGRRIWTGGESIEVHDAFGHLFRFIQYPRYAEAIVRNCARIVLDPIQLNLIPQSTRSPLSMRFQKVMEAMSFLRVSSTELYELLSIPVSLQGLRQYSVRQLSEFLSTKNPAMLHAMTTQLLFRYPMLMDHVGALHATATFRLESTLAGIRPDSGVHALSVWAGLAQATPSNQSEGLARAMTFLLQLNVEDAAAVVGSALQPTVSPDSAFGRLWFLSGLISNEEARDLGF